jgi:hypothetical protein
VPLGSVIYILLNKLVTEVTIHEKNYSNPYIAGEECPFSNAPIVPLKDRERMGEMRR